jgi:hypothetical protein
MEAGLRIGLMLVSILVAGLSAGAQQPGAQVSEPGEQAFVDWARQNAIPLKTVEAGHGFEDMAPVGRSWAMPASWSWARRRTGRTNSFR